METVAAEGVPRMGVPREPEGEERLTVKERELGKLTEVLRGTEMVLAAESPSAQLRVPVVAV